MVLLGWCSMADLSHAPGWWLASDGNWYAPELHPSHQLAATEFRRPNQSVHTVDSPVSPDPSLAGLPFFAPVTPIGAAGPPDTRVAPTGYFPSGPRGPFPTPGYVPGGYPTSLPEASTNGLAIASLVLAIIPSFGIGSILAIIFGFMARSQIARSHGRQKGAGLALAGIIVGFLILSLILLAIAIPTFLGVQRHNHSVERLPASPIHLGTAIDGGSAAPITWIERSQVFDTIVAPTPNGVTMAISSSHHSEWASVPVTIPAGPSMPLSADVAVVSGATSNGIGLGCIAPDLNHQFAVLIHNTGEWEVKLFIGDRTARIDSGSSSSIRSVGRNKITVLCSPVLGAPGFTSVELEVNGSPVVHDIVRYSAASWAPTIQMCSCDGPAVGTFSAITYFASPSASTS